MIRRSILAAGFLLLPRLGVAQCPDGTPPPCAGERRPAPPDPNRIAILPFRTSGADSSLAYLRDGLVELLAAEFTGEAGPAAVDPGTALRAWARASGGAPMGQAPALRLARELGAGQLLLGAVVGTPRRMTVTASIVTVPDGRVRVPSVVVEGSADSLGTVIAALSTRLLGRSSGAWRLSASDPGTTSPEALRAFIAGRAAYREGRFMEMVPQLFRTVVLDSTFVLAEYWLVLWHALGGVVAVPDAARVLRLAWAQRARLGTGQRPLLEAIADSNALRWRGDMLPRIERIVPGPGSAPEAWWLLGDNYLHVGAALGYEDWSERARRALLRSLDLDTNPQTVSHLAMLAFAERDLDRHTQLVAILNRIAPESRSAIWDRYAGAVLRGNADAVHAARIAVARVGRRGLVPINLWLTGLSLPQAEVDSLLILLADEVSSEPARLVVARLTAATLSNGGRPARAAEVHRGSFGRDTVAEDLEALVWATNDSAAAERLSRSEMLIGAGSWTVGCEVILSRLRRADTTGVVETVAALQAVGSHGATVCAAVAEAVVASQAPSRDLLPLLRADSMMRSFPPDVGEQWNYDVALAFARRGEWRAAAAAARRRYFGFGPVPRLVLMLRGEGRWGALAGDTVAAIRAYRHYLLWRETPEPSLIPERDSVRAELARLERRL